MIKQFFVILAGTVVGQLLWDRVIEPKLDEKEKEDKDKKD